PSSVASIFITPLLPTIYPLPLHDALPISKDYEKLTSWIPAYDLETHYEKLDKRPLFFWHGTEDEKIPFALTKQFLSKNTGPEITAYVEKEKHMVQVETMDKVTAFFVDHLKKDFV